MKNKIKYTLDRPQLSKEQVRARMNFAKVLEDSRKPTATHSWKLWALMPFGLAALWLLSHWLYYSLNGTPVIQEVKSSQARTQPISTAIPEAQVVERPVFVNQIPLAVVPGDRDSMVLKMPMLPSKDITPFRFPEMPYSVYKVKTNVPSRIMHNGKTELKIPHQCFVDSKGRVVNGEVDLKVRELRDAYDILISGTPMAYDSAGQRHYLQTAGMIEVRGFQNGLPVYIAPRKSIEVLMPSDIADPAYNLYLLDEQKQTWKYLGKDKVITRTSEANAEEKRVGGAVYDNIDFKNYLPAEPKQENLKSQNFQLVLGPKSKNDYEELDQLYYEVENTEGRIPDLFYEAVWHRITIHPGDVRKGDSTNRLVNYLFVFESGRYYDTELKKEQVIPALKIKAHPIIKGDDSSRARKVYLKQLKDPKAFNNMLFKGIERMDPVEIARPAINQINEIYRAFSMLNFGVYNCDQIYRYTNLPVVKVNLPKALYSEMYGVYLSVADITNRTVIPMAVDRLGIAHINCNPKSQILILATTKEGELMYLSPTEFDKARRSEGVEVIFKKMGFEYTEASQFKAFLKDL